MNCSVTADQIPPAMRSAIARIVEYHRADEERDYAGCGDAPGQNAREGHIYEDIALVSRWLNDGGDDQGQPDASSIGRPAAAGKQQQDDAGDVVRVRVTWSEIVTREAARDLDAARMRRLGYDPRDPGSIARYLQAADSLDGDDWYPWHSEFSEDARRIDTDNAEISSVTIEP
jgi:hypothetical protein